MLGTASEDLKHLLNLFSGNITPKHIYLMCFHAVKLRGNNLRRSKEDMAVAF